MPATAPAVKQPGMAVAHAGRAPSGAARALGSARLPLPLAFRRAGAARPARPARRSAPAASAHPAAGAPPAAGGLTAERSQLANREAVLFLFQLEMDAQLQRALTYEKFDVAQEIRARRQQVDEALRELQAAKGYGCGARHASRAAAVDFAPAALSLRSRLAAAVAAEAYADAAALRDELAALEERAAEAELPCPVAEPRFSLGEMAVHTGKGYRGVICGWDLACCESPEWRAAAGVDSLRHGADQVFYHVLVDVGDWPQGEFPDDDEPPVAYVAEELLAAASMADFASPEPLALPSFQHPYSYLMFLGSDGHGNMIPCRQLRDKYCVARRDVYTEDDDGEEEGGGGGGDGDGPWPATDGGDGGSGGGNSAWGGGSTLPGIDMSSLD